MGVPAWCAVNELADATRLDGQGLSSSEPNIWGVSQLEDAFPATQLYDFHPGTIARFAALAERALVAEFSVAKSFDTIWLSNHNLPTDVTLKLMTSATGVVGTWGSIWSASVAQLGKTDFAEMLSAPVSSKYVALVLVGVGSLAAPGEIGEWGIGTRTAAPTSWEFDAAIRSRVGRRVSNRSQYGVLESKALGTPARAYEGSIGLGEGPTGMDTLELLFSSTNYGASPFLWINDVADPVAICATGEGLEEFAPRLQAPGVYGSVSLRIEEVPRGRGTV